MAVALPGFKPRISEWWGGSFAVAPLGSSLWTHYCRLNQMVNRGYWYMPKRSYSHLLTSIRRTISLGLVKFPVLLGMFCYCSLYCTLNLVWHFRPVSNNYKTLHWMWINARLHNATYLLEADLVPLRLKTRMMPTFWQCQEFVIKMCRLLQCVKNMRIT